MAEATFDKDDCGLPTRLCVGSPAYEADEGLSNR
jgi:hypothetical protein